MTQYIYFEIFLYFVVILALYIRSPLFSWEKFKDFLFKEEEIEIKEGQTWWRILHPQCPIQTLQILKVNGDKITIKENDETKEVYSGYLNSFKCSQ